MTNVKLRKTRQEEQVPIWVQQGVKTILLLGLLKQLLQKKLNIHYHSDAADKQVLPLKNTNFCLSVP